MKTCTLNGVQPTKGQAHRALRVREGDDLKKLMFQWAPGWNDRTCVALEVMYGSVSGDEFHFAGPVFRGDGLPCGNIAVGHYNFRTNRGEVSIGQRSEIVALQTYTHIDLSPLK